MSQVEEKNAAVENAAGSANIEQEDLNKLTVKQLTQRLVELGHENVKGKKAELLEKLKAGLQQKGGEQEASSGAASSKKRERTEEEEEKKEDSKEQPAESAEKAAKTEAESAPQTEMEKATEAVMASGDGPTGPIPSEARPHEETAAAAEQQQAQ